MIDILFGILAAYLIVFLIAGIMIIAVVVYFVRELYREGKQE